MREVETVTTDKALLYQTLKMNYSLNAWREPHLSIRVDPRTKHQGSSIALDSRKMDKCLGLYLRAPSASPFPTEALSLPPTLKFNLDRIVVTVLLTLSPGRLRHFGQDRSH